MILQGLNIVDTGAAFYEFARFDASIATFMMLQNAVGINTVDKLGNEEQKKRCGRDKCFT